MRSTHSEVPWSSTSTARCGTGSQRTGLDWKRMSWVVARWLPSANIVHRWPNATLASYCHLCIASRASRSVRRFEQAVWDEGDL
jgi:hypothetical protein